jgi:hypothetical protein
MSENIWFHNLFGILERGSASYRTIQKSFTLNTEQRLITAPNGRIFQCGKFYTPSVQDLRQEVSQLIRERRSPAKSCSFDHLPIQDVLDIHCRFPHSVIQAASQFNCLEFPSPRVTPEVGIDQYASDRTQGPACAIACPAGTLFRNYFASVGDQIGQTAQNQINNLEDLETLLSNAQHRYFYVKNGYVFTESADNLRQLCTELSERDPERLDEYRRSIRIGIQEDTEVSFRRRYVPTSPDEERVLVTQAYCSALSCGYSGVATDLWEPLARLVLEAAYEATILVAIKNALRLEMQTGEDEPSPDTFRDVFLTAVGGGVFANDMAWIGDAIGRAITIAESYEIDLRIHVCHYRVIHSALQEAVEAGYARAQSMK